MADLIEFGRHLLTLEVDTIVSDGITAEQMPQDGQALIRIAQLYKAFLAEVLAEMRDCGADPGDLPIIRQGDGVQTEFADWDVSSGGMRTYGILRRVAHACRRARDAAPRPNTMRPEHDAILVRLTGACNEVQSILRRLKLTDAAIDTGTVELAEEEGYVWPSLDRETVLQLRRIWETGVDVIVMQTLVRLDGSLVTRVLDGWDTQDASILHDVHYRAVDISLQRWSMLVRVAQDLAGFFLGRSSGPESDTIQPDPALVGIGAGGGAAAAAAGRP